MVRGPVSMVLVGIIMLVMGTLVMGGPRAFEKILPESAIVWLETMGGGEMGGMVSQGSFGGRTSDSNDPLDHLDDTSDGWEGDGLIAATAGGGAVFIAQVMDGWSGRVEGDYPASTETLVPLTGCAPTAPSADAALMHVRASDTGNPVLGLATYGDADLAAAVETYVDRYRATGLKSQAKLERLAFEAYDVAVTETARPVYLVLEAGAFGMPVFNVHLAPGARLERVVILGGAQAGVANVAAEVPVEVLRAAEMTACDMHPFYPLNPNHLFYQGVESGVIHGEELAEYEARYEAQRTAWDAAFRAMFGVGAIDTVIGNWNKGRMSVAGPVPAAPEARAVWKPIEGSLVRLTVDKYVEYPGLEAEGVDFAGRVEAMATAFAWGDLKNVKAGVRF